MTFTMHLPFRLFTVMVAAGLTAGAARSDAPQSDRCLAPYFLVTSESAALDCLPLKSTRVAAEIAGVVAEVRVVQTYENCGTQPIEATYVFPAATRAAVHGLTMTVGGRRVVARVKERGAARHDYEQAKAQGRTASLLEEHRPNVLQMNLANILPGDVIEVELDYSELLVPNEGVYEWCFPTVVGPRYSNRAAATAREDERWVASPYLPAGAPPVTAFGLEARLVAGMPLQEVASPSHRLQIDFRTANEAIVRPAADEVTPANRDFVLRYRLAGGAIESGLLVGESAGGGSFLLLIEPPPRPAPTMIPPRDYLFVVDVSGSMHGFPLDTAKALVCELAARLRSQDRFNVLLFSGGSDVLSPVPLVATPENLGAALDFLDRQQGGGGTELLAAMQRALALPATAEAARIVAVVTDGYVDMEPELFELVRANLGHASLFAFGIGTSVNRHLIEGLARAGRGEPFIVADSAQAVAGATAFREMIESPVLTNVRIEFSGLDVHDVTPPAVPDLFARRPVVLTGQWNGKAAGTIQVRGRTGEQEWSAMLDVAAAARVGSAELLERLWARERIAELSDLQALSEDDGRKLEVTRLGLTYNLLTRYTSFVAIDELVRRTPGAPLPTVAQPSVLPQGVSNLAIGGDVSTSPEPATAVLLIAGAAVVAFGVWSRRSKRSLA